MKVHVGADWWGLVHSVVTGPAPEGDITRLDDLLHGQERELFGDQAYWSEDHRQHCRETRIANASGFRSDSLLMPATSFRRLASNVLLHP